VLASEVIDRTLNEYLYPAGVDRPSFDKLSGNIDAATLTIPLTGRLTNVPPDTVLEIGSELILTDSVAGVTVTAKERGYLESVAATHSTGDIVTVDPRYPRVAILNALKGIIGMLRPWGLYVRATDVTQAFTSRNVLPLPTGGRRLISIAIRDQGSNETYSVLNQQGVDWIFYPHFTPPKYHLRKGGSEGAAMTVIFEKDFTMPATEADDVTTVSGVPDTLAPFLSMAVAGQLLAGKEATRVQIEAIRRLLASQGVQVGASMNLSQTLLGMFRTVYVMAERRRLGDLDPPATFEWIRSR